MRRIKGNKKQILNQKREKKSQNTGNHKRDGRAAEKPQRKRKITLREVGNSL
jgi:hypothetical protein